MASEERLESEKGIEKAGNPTANINKGLSPVQIFCICLSVVVVVLLGVVIYLLVNPKTITTIDDATTPREVLITPENVDELVADIQTPNPDGSYTASMNIDWYFDEGSSSSSNAYVENAVMNTRTMYFEVFLADTEEMVYSSPFIPVGSILKELTLDEDLDVGDYEAIVVYHLVDDDYKELSTVSVTVNLHILN